MFKVKFKKIRNNHNRIRTDVIEGITHELPEVESQFAMLAEGLEFGTRYVQTSPVKNIESMDNKYQLFTESGSLYEVEVLGSVDEKDNLQ